MSALTVGNLLSPDLAGSHSNNVGEYARDASYVQNWTLPLATTNARLFAQLANGDVLIGSIVSLASGHGIEQFQPDGTSLGVIIDRVALGYTGANNIDVLKVAVDASDRIVVAYFDSAEAGALHVKRFDNSGTETDDFGTFTLSDGLPPSNHGINSADISPAGQYVYVSEYYVTTAGSPTVTTEHHVISRIDLSVPSITPRWIDDVVTGPQNGSTTTTPAYVASWSVTVATAMSGITVSPTTGDICVAIGTNTPTFGASWYDGNDLDYSVRRFDSSGALVGTYPLYSVSSSGFSHIALDAPDMARQPAYDGDGANLWLTMGSDSSYSTGRRTYLYQLEIASGTVTEISNDFYGDLFAYPGTLWVYRPALFPAVLRYAHAGTTLTWRTNT